MDRSQIYASNKSSNKANSLGRKVSKVLPIEINQPNKIQIRLIYSFGILLGLSVMAIGLAGLWFEAQGRISSNGMASQVAK